MKKILFILPLLFFFSSSIPAQTSEIECIITARMGAYVTLKPAYFDELVLPKVGEQVTLYIYLKDELPAGVDEGFFELFPISVMKLVPEDKIIRFKCLGDIETAKTKHGIPHIQLNIKKRVKIIWTQSE